MFTPWCTFVLIMTAKINYGRPTWETLLINISNGIFLIIAFYWYKFYHVCYFCAAFFGLYIVAKGFLIIKFTEISHIIKIRQPIKLNYIKLCFPGVFFHGASEIQDYSLLLKIFFENNAYLILLQKRIPVQASSTSG